MKKRGIWIVLIVFVTTLVGGCWNYREIDKMAIVAGAALDKGKGNTRYSLATEVVNFSAGAKGSSATSSIIHADGNSFFEAIRNGTRKTGKRQFWSHAQLVIISEDMAREGVVNVMDWITRDPQPRLTMDILVAKESSSDDIISTPNLASDINSAGIVQMIRSGQDLSQSPQLEVYQIIDLLAGEGVSMVIPAVKKTKSKGKDTIILDGLGIFKRDKLIGFLSQRDTTYYMYVRNQVSHGLLTYAGTGAESKKGYTLEVMENQTKVKPVVKDGKVIMEISIQPTISVSEMESTSNKLEQAGLKSIKRQVDTALKKDILKTVKTVQKDFGVDIFGFGAMVKNDQPSVWRKIGKDWEYWFKDLPVNVTVDSKVTNTGLARGPIEVGD